jgi:hypothetical protein
MEGNTTLMGRGYRTTDPFERSCLLGRTAGASGLAIADLSDVASEASAKPLLQEAKSEPPCLPPSPRKGLDSTIAPEGQKDSAQGFNPGFTIPMRRALKVAPEYVRTGRWIRKFNPWRQICCPFRAHRLKMLYPGLKPRG